MDVTTPAASQADTATEPQTQAVNTTTEQSSLAEDSSSEQISLAEAKKLRSEAAGLRKRIKAYEEAEAKANESRMTEQEKLQKQLVDLQTQHSTALQTNQQRIINYEVRLQAASMGIVDPDAAAKLLDWSRIDYDDAGMPTNIDGLLKQLLKDKPYLGGKVASPSSGGATNPSRSTTNATPLSWDVITKMTREQVQARQKEIEEWMMQQPRRV